MSHQAYTNLSGFDIEVLAARAISPTVAALRGTRTEGDRMVIPLHNTQGESDAGSVIYRPHAPVTGPDGKDRKYLFPIGAEMILDVHPLSLPYLNDVRVPIIITESALKADATQSAIKPGTFCVVSFSGVWNWVSNGTPLVADFRDVRWRTKDGDHITHRRLVFIAFDSDAADKAGPIRARWELGKFLKRKHADVRLMDVPAAPDGSKQGIDDALKVGGPALLGRLIEAAHSVPETMPLAPGEVTLTDRLQAENRRLKRDNARLEKDNHALIRLVENTHLKPTEKTVLVRTGRLAMEAKAKVGTDPNGNVRISPSELANDWRPRNHTGQHNPRDGSRIITARKTVPALLEGLRHIAPLDYVNVFAGRDPVTKKPYMNDILIEPPDALHNFLKPFAWYEPGEQVNRQVRTPAPPKHTPCIHCGEVHDLVRTDTCTGCEKVVATRVIDRTTVPETVSDPAAGGGGDTLSPKEPSLTLVDTLSPPPSEPADVGARDTLSPPLGSPTAPPRPITEWPQRGTYVFGRPDSPPSADEAGNDWWTRAGGRSA